MRDHFGAAHQHLSADFICSLSVFEDIPEPRPFLAAVHALAAQRGATVYFEVFNAWRAFEQKEVWSVHYEQCNYFSLNSLQNVLQRHGFKIEDRGTCYEGDQYLFVEATPAPSPQSAPAALESPAIPEILHAYERAFLEKQQEWNRRLATCRNAGERVVVWGTGGKGITFLNALSEARTIEYVAEINPDKQGKYVPGTGQLIVSPEFLSHYQPHKIIITNALYEAEMKSQARKLGLNAEFLIA